MSLKEHNKKLDELDAIASRISKLNCGIDIIPHTQIEDTTFEAQKLIDECDCGEDRIFTTTNELMLNLRVAYIEIEELQEYLNNTLLVAENLNEVLIEKDNKIKHYKKIIESLNEKLVD